jgi:gamma-glutamyltranspeptidase
MAGASDEVMLIDPKSTVLSAATASLCSTRNAPFVATSLRLACDFTFRLKLPSLLVQVAGYAGLGAYTAKTAYGMLNLGLNAQQAINLPNFGVAGAPTLIEEKRFPASTVDALKGRGHEVFEQSMVSGLQAIDRANLNPASGGGSGRLGGADPRREGIVRGD